MQTRLIPCRTDNYAVLLHEGNSTVLIDAPETAPILSVLDKEGWALSHVLITHHHPDHTDGLPELVKRFSPEVFAPAKEEARIPCVTRTVKKGDTVEMAALKAHVFETPGHTLGHVSYWFEREELLFAADTLFSLGCGRLLEGDAAMMWASLQKLRALPDSTSVYCGHEYTEANARFALSIDPDNTALQARALAVKAARAEGKPTIPFNLGEDKAANPFLRADDAALAARLGLSGASATEVFAEIRKRKDSF